MALEVGTRLGHYDVTSLLGEGGMGQVWQATDTQLGRQVALKILPDAFAADPDRLARFTREAQILPASTTPTSPPSTASAYDTIAFYDAASARHAMVVVPPARTASLSRRGPRSSVRNRTIRRVQVLGRRRWTKASGYHRQARVENVIFRYKSTIGAGLRARSAAGRQTETLLGCNILNRMTGLGRPASYSIGS